MDVRQSTVAGALILLVVVAACVPILPPGESREAPSPLEIEGVQCVVAPREEGWSPVSGMSWSPDGTRLALAYSARLPRVYVYVVDVEEPEPRILERTRLKGEISSPAWSPTSNRIAFYSTSREPRGIWIADTEDQEALGFLGRGTECAWAPDGERIAIGGEQGSTYSLYVLNLRTGERWEVLRMSDEAGRSAQGWGLSWSATGDRLAFAVDFAGRYPSTETTMGIYELDLASGRNRLLSEGAWRMSPSWSPDGTMVAFSSGERSSEPTLAIMDVGSGTMSCPLSIGEILGVAWSPDGDTIAFEHLGGVYTIDTALVLEQQEPCDR